MTFMFDPEPTTPAPRVRLLHTHRGHILGLRAPGKPYLVLPSAPCEPTEQDSDAVTLAAAVFASTGLVVSISSGYYGRVMRTDSRECSVTLARSARTRVGCSPGTRLHDEATIVGGTLRPSAGFFHPREWAGSPDADHLGDLLTSDPPPLALEQVRVYPHEVVPGDIYNFPIVGTRYERNAHGEESVTFQYENYSGAALGKDDAFGEDGEEAPEEDGRGGRKRKVTERNTALGRAWGSPHDLRAQILVYRLGGDYRGEST